PTIMLMSKRIGLRSEASARFERGMDPNAARIAADRVAELLVELAGGTIGGLVDAYPSVVEPSTVTLELTEIPRVLGVDIDESTATGYLTRLGFGVSGGDSLDVAVPTRRPDVMRPIDLIEEIARLHGYDEFPDRVAFGTGGGIGTEERRSRRLREVLVGAGYHEAMTFSFIGAEDLDRLGLPEDDPRRAGIAVINPLHAEQGVMRTTLLPGLLKAASYNVARKAQDVAVFELGKTFLASGDVIPDQPDTVTFVTVGGEPSSWLGDARPRDVFDALGMLDLIARTMRISDLRLEQADVPPFHPERGAHVVHGGVIIGTVGEIHPAVAARFDLPGRVTAAEISAESFLADAGRWTFAPPSAYPPVIFDLAFEVPDATTTRDLTDVLHRADHVESVDVFDVFRGGSIAEGHRSIAVRLSLRAPDRTLTDEEVAPIREAMVAAVTEATGARLRGAL
ncbi:MAG: phenylalanine--tRNA ligase subunit beta, partial [Acidimicrobiia bacterium]|nr:phenylalanine--tRNA ligase subunit beta [Acidimicrobiia bacterium]